MDMLYSQFLDEKEKYNDLEVEIPNHITDNLAERISLRPYQQSGIKRFLWTRRHRPHVKHNLYQMATGSGKTVLMAAIMLDLYSRGYRNFLFFVNSTQIIQKTKENFLARNSSKYLLAEGIKIGGKLVQIRAVDNFETMSDNIINVHFTTIQGLHAGINEPRENSTTIEDFTTMKTVFISDEAHHINAETRALNRREANERKSWEKTVKKIFNSNPDNILLEFTATIDLENSFIKEKYREIIIYDYPLSSFRKDGYSKDIELLQADLSPEDRMLQAVILSQYRRKIAERRGIHCKPVILMKSKTIVESKSNEDSFNGMISNLVGERLLDTYRASPVGSIIHRALGFIFDERGVSPNDFARELAIDFTPEKVINVNRPEDLDKQQINLNTLEDRDNETRVVFAVDKLNEGWDVLNLFDIVRLYDTRGGRSNMVDKTTMQEAQLIGRGARYFPFKYPARLEVSSHIRKFDSEIDNEMRILEQLYYHCAHNPRYISEIKNALKQTGMWDDSERTITVNVKDSFKKTDVYKSYHVWVNDKVQSRYRDLKTLLSESTFEYPRLLTGDIIQSGAFEDSNPPILSETISRETALKDLGRHVMRFAMDFDFFNFYNLRYYFPNLKSRDEFVNSGSYLGGVKIKISGKRELVDNLEPSQKVNIARHVLSEIKNTIKTKHTEYVGTKTFKPELIKKIITNKTLKLPIIGESGRAWQESNIDGLAGIDLEHNNWYVYDNNYGSDQEKHFIKFIHDNKSELKKAYDEFFLIRNEKAVTLYNFADGAAFEPDFLLFLSRMEDEQNRVLLLFIEPKGEHLMQKDSWKEAFLGEIKNKASLQQEFLFMQNKHYAVYGLPFFNERGTAKRGFDEAFQSIVKFSVDPSKK